MTPSSAQRYVARTAFFMSGIAGLTFEIVWMRYLGLAMGGTTLAVATTTAVYMGGLALGSHFGGKYSDRLKHPLATYGVLEILLATVGLLLPIVLTKISAVDAALLVDAESAFARGLVRFGVAVALLAIPTTVMGMTLPVLARAVTDKAHKVGSEVGLLYALNIGGAMVGAACAGFWWLPALGLQSTNGVAVAIDAALGVVTVALGVLFVRRKQASTEEPKAEATGKALLRPGTVPVVAVLAVTGAAAMGLQVLWTRAIGTALGPSTYAFSAIVCSYLLGLTMGGVVASKLSTRIGHAELTLAGVIMATGFLALLGTAWVDDLPLLLQGVALDETLTLAGLVRTEFGLAALIVLPATIGMGAIFPLTLSVVVGSDAKIGGAVGRVYAINTLGNIAGSFGAVFVLLPVFGVEWGLRVAALAYVLGGTFLALRDFKVFNQRIRFAAAAVIMLLVGTLWPSWDIGQWTLGLYRMSTTRAYYDEGTPKASPVVFHEDGLASTVTVEEEDGVRWIKVDGKIDGSSEGDMPTQVLSGMLPLVVHPDPKRVAVIGCGSCVTAGSALVTGVEEVILIEIEPAVIRGAHLFENVNHAPWNDSRFSIVEDDGRNFLRRTTEPFDVIISEPSNPWMTGASSLFTKDFFTIAESRLKDGGMFLQWLQIYELAPDRIGSVLKTFNSVFPYVAVFSAHPDSNDLLMVGSREPVKLPWSQLTKRFDNWSKELERADLEYPGELLALLLFDERGIATLDENIPLNTDDNALIEFGAPRDLITFADDDPTAPLVGDFKGKRFQLVSHLLGYELPENPRAAEPEYVQRMLDIAEGYLRQGMLRDSEATVRFVTGILGSLDDEQLKVAMTRAENTSELARLLLEANPPLDIVDAELVKNDPEYAKLAAFAAADRFDDGIDYLDEVKGLGKRSSTHALLAGYVFYEGGWYTDARIALLRAESSSKKPEEKPRIAYYLAREAYEQGNYSRAVEKMQSYRNLSQEGDLSGSSGQE